MFRAVRRSLVAAGLLAPALVGATQETLPPALHTSLPKDSLVVFAVSTDELTSKLEASAGWLARAADGPQLSEVLAVDPAAAGLFARTLLGAIGPEVALAIDLPPLDTLIASIQIGRPEAYATVLSQVGVLAAVRDEQKLHEGLQLLLRGFSAPPVEREGVFQSQIPLEMGDAPEQLPRFLNLYYATRGGRLALGFSRSWVQAGLAEVPQAERLAGGEDFQRVFAQLDPRPESLAYVNLPKLRQLVADSAIIAAVLEDSPELARFVEPLRDPDVMASGLGSTSVAVAGGVRTTHFGPYWMSGTAGSSSVLAALAVPSLLVAAERSRARDTLGDIQTIATACDHFAADAKNYPGPTRGWVPVGDVSAFLEPIYVPTLPRNDAWNNPILYWSDGKTYRVMSTGPDGRMDRDWSHVTEPTQSANKVGDIVVADGRILVLPQPLLD